MIMPNPCLFHDDFSDGIWTKYSGNPVMTRTEDWEYRAICEPSVLVEDGIFKMWYMGCYRDYGIAASLGYATSKDGLTWQKHPGNPILADPAQAIIRTTVIKHEKKYYLFASDYNWHDVPGSIYRWTSDDGLNWYGKVKILEPSGNEAQLDNSTTIIDSDGQWKMIYATNGKGMGLAWSRDGIHWTKHKEFPVLGGFTGNNPALYFYGGDPCLRKIGDTYFVWYSRSVNGPLYLHCSWSTDLVHWNAVYKNPQISFTQPWERGQGRPEAWWCTHLTDADLLEHDGKVLLYYQGAQNPFGLAVFDGTYEQLARRLMNPPLSKWANSPYGCVENNELKLSENETDRHPLAVKDLALSDVEGYTLEFRARGYAGASCQIKPAMRYRDENNFARFWIVNNRTTWYQECLEGGQLGGTADLGPNNICDDQWHDWKIIVRNRMNQLYLDGKFIGQWKSSPGLVGRRDLTIGLSVFDTYASFKFVKVYKNHEQP